MTARSPKRRAVLAAVVLLFACYGVHMDETQIRSIASEDLDCDPSLVTLESGTSPRKDVANYVARGCERSRTYQCITGDDGRVECHHEATGKGSDTPSDDNGVGQAVAATAVGCACAALFASKSSDPQSTSTSPNANSTSSQRSR